MVADLPIEVIQEMALDYSPSDIRNLCQTSKFFNNIICRSTEFWRMKIKHDFGVTFSASSDLSTLKEFWLHQKIIKFWQMKIKHDFGDNFAKHFIREYAVASDLKKVWETFENRIKNPSKLTAYNIFVMDYMLKNPGRGFPPKGLWAKVPLNGLEILSLETLKKIATDLNAKREIIELS